MSDDKDIRVLLIEHDAEDILLTRKLLTEERRRFQMDVAGRLDEALELLRDLKTDAVLLDLNLPDCTGLESFSRLRARFPFIPVILLTGLDDEDLSTLAVQQGAQDYLVKGRFNADQLARAIHYAIERNRAEVALKRYRDHLEELIEARTRELRKAKERLEMEMAERREAEGRQEALEAELHGARKMEAVGRLAGGIAHEFNNALTIILGYGELLQPHLQPGAEPRQDLDEMIIAAERMALLTRQLLAFSRRQVIHPRKTDLNIFLERARAVARPVMPQNIDIKIIAGEERIYAALDPEQIEHVIYNLALNAADAMGQDGGVFEIAVENVIIERPARRDGEQDGRYVCLRISDNGEGMEHEVLERIFEPFFSTKKIGEGAGLGLSVAYGIVKQHDGWIEAASSPGHGSNFRIYLPLIKETHGKIPEEADASRGHEGHGESILLVEDEDTVRVFLKRALERHGYRVTAAENGRKALREFETIRDECRLVFADAVLPDGNGLELVDSLLKRKDDLCVLLTSGYSDGKSNLETIHRRGYSFLRKPYSTSELLDKVATILRRETTTAD